VPAGSQASTPALPSGEDTAGTAAFRYAPGNANSPAAIAFKATSFPNGGAVLVPLPTRKVSFGAPNFGVKLARPGFGPPAGPAAACPA